MAGSGSSISIIMAIFVDTFNSHWPPRLYLNLLQMVRSLAVAARLKAQRVIQEDLTLATLAGTLFRTAINVSLLT
jgi:hypothetical protein